MGKISVTEFRYRTDAMTNKYCHKLHREMIKMDFDEFTHKDREEIEQHLEYLIKRIRQNWELVYDHESGVEIDSDYFNSKEKLALA